MTRSPVGRFGMERQRAAHPAVEGAEEEGGLEVRVQPRDRLGRLGVLWNRREVHNGHKDDRLRPRRSCFPSCGWHRAAIRPVRVEKPKELRPAHLRCVLERRIERRISRHVTHRDT